jgi:hypothetical protein
LEAKARAPILIALLVMGSLAPGATAATEADDAWQRDARRIEVDTQSDRVLLESVRDSALGTDRVILELHRADARIVHTFTATQEDGSITRTATTLRLVALIEHRSPDEGHFGPGSEIVQRHALETLRPGTLQVQRSGDSYRIAVDYAVPDRRDDVAGVSLPDGTLSIGLTLAESLRPLPDQTVRPTEARLDIRIDRYPFQASDSRFAFEYALESDAPFVAGAEDRDAILVTAVPYQSYVAWDDEARLGLLRADVGITLLSRLDETNGQGALLYVSAPQGVQIEHAQTLGTMRVTGLGGTIVDLITRGDPLLYGVVLIATLLAIGLPVARRLREES